MTAARANRWPFIISSARPSVCHLRLQRNLPTIDAGSSCTLAQRAFNHHREGYPTGPGLGSPMRYSNQDREVYPGTWPLCRKGCPCSRSSRSPRYCSVEPSRLTRFFLVDLPNQLQRQRLLLVPWWTRFCRAGRRSSCDGVRSREAKTHAGVNGEAPCRVSPFSLSRGGVTAAAQRRSTNRRNTFREAMDQWFAGNFELCLDLCGQQTDPAPDIQSQVTLLRARALLRLNRADKALSILDEFPWPESGDVAVTARMLVGAALIRSNEVNRGLALLEALQESAIDAHRTIQSEIALNRALGHFCRQEVDAADRDSIWFRQMRISFTLEPWNIVAGLHVAEQSSRLQSGTFAKRSNISTPASTTTAIRGELRARPRLAQRRIVDPPTWAVIVERRAKIDWSAQIFQTSPLLDSQFARRTTPTKLTVRTSVRCARRA